MWDRKKSDTPQPQPTQMPQPQPVNATPMPVARPVEERRTGATIGKAVRIIGDVISGEDLYIDGEVQGTLEARDAKLTIGPNGKAKSGMKAREVVIQGHVHGDVEALQKITIRKEGSLIGNIRTAGIIIEDDAYFKGSIDIVRGAEAQPKAS
jgi:cytoskeletal protein CcmA (bactofilin family)